MIRAIKAAFAGGLLLSVAACTGTGTTDPNEINSLVAGAGGNTAIVARSTGFAGSAPRVFVFMDGTQVAALGNNEVDTFEATPGPHTLSLQFEGPSIGLETNELAYDNDPSRPQYFVINMKQKFVGATMTISEVSASSFPAAIK